jgi:spore coat protein CotH
MRGGSAARAVVLLGVAAIGAGAIVGAQTSADLFDGTRVHEVRLFVHPRDLALLRQNYLVNTFYPATLEWSGVRVRDIAVRSRGLGSRNPIKLGLELDFDRYVAGRRVFGLSSLVLDNLWQDKSLMREALAMATFARAGVAAPRLSFARLYLNHEFQGLYAIVEPIEPAFLGRVFSDPTGYLYEYKWLFDYRGTDLGEDLAVYKPIFESRSRQLESDESLYGPLRDLFQVASRTDAPDWRDQTEARLDLSALVRFLAVEAFIAENDGFLGYAGMNNLYWYRPSGSARHMVLPWDKDFAFTFLDSSIFREVEATPLVRRALEEPDLRSYFLDVSDELVALAETDEWFAAEVERLAALIAPVVEEDTRKQYTTDEFLADLEFLREFARVRPELVRAEVAANR